ncbi:MAG: hypothetical protein ACK5MQ_01995 [Pikeienuella sp.]
MRDAVPHILLLAALLHAAPAPAETLYLQKKHAPRPSIAESARPAAAQSRRPKPAPPRVGLRPRHMGGQTGGQPGGALRSPDGPADYGFSGKSRPPPPDAAPPRRE